MAVKFPLKMPDGMAVRNIEQLREHFDFRTVLEYYSNGRLKEWLEERYYDEEAQKLGKLDLASEKFKEELCAILGVPYMERLDAQIDVEDIVKKSKRRERLKKYTTDDVILASADNVVFTQKELAGLLKRLDLFEVDDEDNRVIYLCGEYFIIPANIGNVIYRGINNPIVKFDGEIVESGIDLQDLKCDISDYIEDCSWGMMHNVFKNNLSLGLKILRQEADQGNADAQFVFGLWCLQDDDIADMTGDEDPMKWWQEAAKQGHVDANVFVYNFRSLMGNLKGEEAKEAVKWYKKEVEQDRLYVAMAYEALGRYYICGEEQNFKEAVGYLKRAVECDENNGDEVVSDIAYYLGYCYYYGKGVKQDYKVAVRWLQYASDKDYMDATVLLGMCYQYGRGIKEDSAMAVEMYRKGAEIYNENALYLLGCCYFGGIGVEKSYEEAAKWIQKAIDLGYKSEEAKKILSMCKWRVL